MSRRRRLAMVARGHPKLSIVSDDSYLLRTLGKRRIDAPPFATREIISKDDPCYEDTVFDFYFQCIKGNDFTVGINELNTLTIQKSTFRNLPVSSSSLGPVKLEDIKSIVACKMSNDLDGNYDDESKVEVWVLFDPSKEFGIKEDLISATRTLLQLPTHRTYPNSDYRGNIFIHEKSLYPPLYLYEELGLGKEVVLYVRGNDSAMSVNIPEEMAPLLKWPEKAFENLPEDMSVVEKVVMEQFMQKCLPSFSHLSLKHEPNGKMTFPDFMIDGCLAYFEITTLRDIFKDRMMDLDKGSHHLDKMNVAYGKSDAKRTLNKAVNTKAEMVQKVPRDHDYVLILVSEFYPLHSNYSIWKGLDLSPFTAVFIANRKMGSKDYEFEYERVPK